MTASPLPPSAGGPSELVRRHWGDPASYHKSWARRAKFVAGMCEPHQWICDVGCGPQSLRYLLPRTAVYLPADLNQWTSDTEFCDLNAGILPIRSLELSDLTLMLGVLTYIQDPETLIRQLADHTEFLILSYFNTELQREPNPYWGKALKLDELEGILFAAGFHVVTQVPFQHWHILKLVNERYGEEMQARRAAARLSFESRPWRLIDEWRRLRSFCRI